MIVLLLVVAAVKTTVLDDRTFELPRGDWKFVDAPVVEAASLRVTCSVMEGPPVRVTLLRRDRLDRFRYDRDNHFLLTTDYTRAARFDYGAMADAYAVAVESDPAATASSRVQLKVELIHRAADVLPAGRRLSVVAISLAVFAVTLIYARRAADPRA